MSPKDFEQTFFSRLKQIETEWEMSPFVFGKEIGYPGSQAQEMILFWAQHGLIDLKAFDKTVPGWKPWYQFDRNGAIFLANRNFVTASLTAQGIQHAERLERRSLGTLAPV
jgi:hypothetical protein